VLVVVMVALVVFCVLGLASVGLFYVPATVPWSSLWWAGDKCRPAAGG
jgi:hypothetical protein